MKINENTKVKVRIPKELYESVKKELAKKKIQEAQKQPQPLNEDLASMIATGLSKLAEPEALTQLGNLMLGFGGPLAAIAGYILNKRGAKVTPSGKVRTPNKPAGDQ